MAVEYLILAGCVALAIFAGFRQFGGEVAQKAFCQGQAVRSLSGGDCEGAPGGSESPFAGVEIAGNTGSAQETAEQDDACADGWRGSLCRLANRGEDLVRDVVGHLPGGDFVADYAGQAWSLPDAIMQSVLPLFGAGGAGAPGVVETWTGTGKQLAALGCAGIPGACSLLNSGFVPGFDEGEATQIQIDTGKAFVGWDAWAEGEYGTAAGTLLPNVALLFAPGPKVSGLARASRVAAPDAPRGRPGEPGCVGSHCAADSSQCFAAGTLVHTESGLLPIENVQEGDLVWSRDEATGEVALRRVVQTFVNPAQPILDLSFEGERDALQVTYEHPFYTRDRGWVAAADLRTGEPVLRRTGEFSRVASSHPARERADVFNFEVAEFHSYFVGTLGVWVHNKCTNIDLAHASIATDLYNGRIIEAVPFSANGNMTPIYRVKLYNDATGRTREALFKPRSRGDNDGYGRQPMEYVGYEVNRMLGMDYVPPVAYRRHVDIGSKHFDEGAMLYLVPDAHGLHSVPLNKWGISQDGFFSDTRILDVLMHNPDRHKDNYLRGKHWVDGSYQPMLIDQAAGLRPGTAISLRHSDGFPSGEIRVIRRPTYDALKDLNHEQLKREVGEFVSDAEIRDILDRRDYIVDYFDQRIEKHGYKNVVK